MDGQTVFGLGGIKLGTAAPPGKVHTIRVVAKLLKQSKITGL